MKEQIERLADGEAQELILKYLERKGEKIMELQNEINPIIDYCYEILFHFEYHLKDEHMGIRRAYTSQEMADKAREGIEFLIRRKLKINEPLKIV